MVSGEVCGEAVMSSCCAYMTASIAQIGYLVAFATSTELDFKTWQYWVFAMPVSFLIFGIIFTKLEKTP